MVNITIMHTKVVFLGELQPVKEMSIAIGRMTFLIGIDIEDS